MVIARRIAARRALPWSIATSALLALAACGGGGDGATGPKALPPAALALKEGDNQTVPAGTPVTVAPSVLVTDSRGDPVPNVPVTFSVATGGGTLAGAQATTNTDGVATLGGWTLGTRPGPNTLTVSGPTGLPAITFRAVGLDVCAVLQPFSLTAGASATLTAIDCALSFGAFADFFVFTPRTPLSMRFTMTSGAVDALLSLSTTDGTPVAANDDLRTGTTDASFRVLTSPGAYVLAATSFNPGEVGAYTLSAAPVPADVTGCEEIFITSGVTTAQSIQASDCPSTADASGARYNSDEFGIWLVAGRTYTFELTSTAFDAWLLLFAPDGRVIAQNDNISATDRNARIVFTATADGLYYVDAGPAVRGALGEYTLVIR